MPSGVRRALRTAQPTGRIAYKTNPTPFQNDLITPVGDAQPFVAAPAKPPTSDGSLVAPDNITIYNNPTVLAGVVNGNITSEPAQIVSRET